METTQTSPILTRSRAQHRHRRKRSLDQIGLARGLRIGPQGLMIKAAMNPAELTIPPRKLTPLMAQRIAKSQTTRRAKDLVVYQRTLRIDRKSTRLNSS